MKTEINDTGQLQRLSPSEVARIAFKARMIRYWDINFPVAYRWYRKLIKWIGAEL